MGARSGEGDFIGRAHQAPSPHAQAGESSAAKEQDADKGEQEQEKGANDARGTPSGMQVGAASAGGQGEETSSDMPKSEGAQCAAPEKNASAEEGPPGGMSSAVDATASTPVQDSVQESTLSSGSRTPVLTAAADPAGCRSSSDSPIPPPPPDDDACAPVAGLPAQAPAAAASGAGSQTSAMPASTAADAPPVSGVAEKPKLPAGDSSGGGSSLDHAGRAPLENSDSVYPQATSTASTPFGKVSDVPYAHTPQSLLRPGVDPRVEYDAFVASQVAAQASASQLMATPNADGRREDTPGSMQEEITQGRRGRKPKELPPGFERVVEGSQTYWLTPDKTKCTKWTQVEAWVARNQPGALPGSAAQPGAGPSEQGRNEKYDECEPPQDIAEFLGFVVFYLLKEEREDEVYDLINYSPPNVNGVDVNLCELFHHVRELGGFEKMHMRAWKSLLQTMKLPASTQDASTISGIYDRFLVCCEGKPWNKDELHEHAPRLCGADRKANLKTLLRRGLLRAGQELTWKKRRRDYEAEGQTPGPDNKEPAVVGRFNEEGQIELDGCTYKSLNAFAGAAFLHFGLGPKSKADKLDGWNSVKTKALDGKFKSLQQIKNEYLRGNAEKMKRAVLRPHELFSKQAHGLRQQKSQAEMREREEAERQQQLEREKLLAENPPPAWIPPQDDTRYFEEVEKGIREATVNMDLEKMIVDLETGTAQDNLDLAENALQEILKAVRLPNRGVLACVAVSPMVLNRLTKCCWGWLCKSSYAAPYGKWQINMDTVKYRLQSELDPKKGRVHWRHKGRFASAAAVQGADVPTRPARSSIGAQYAASKLPPGWRREERHPETGRGTKNANFKFYTYFSPDGKTFTKWPDALAYFVEVEEEKFKEAEKANAAAGGADQAAAAGNAGAVGAEDEKGAEDDGDKQMADEEGEEDEEEDDEDEEMGEGDDQERRQQQQQKQKPSEATNATGDSAQLWWCTCCHSTMQGDGTCKMVMRDQIFGQSFQVTREGGMQAARCGRLARAYILLLKYVCMVRECMARVGSHGETVQLLIEIITADLCVPNDHGTAIDTICLELLNGIAHVINLKVAPGKRLLKAISHAIRVQGTDAAGNRMRLELLRLLARLADCPHNKQVMAEHEHEVLPTVLPLFMYPQGVGGYQMLSMALDAVHRFSSFDAIPSVLRRLNGTPGCIAALVRIVCGAYEPLHKREQVGRPAGAGKVELSDRIHAARVLLKVAEGSGGIASLQRHEKELVCPLAQPWRMLLPLSVMCGCSACARMCVCPHCTGHRR